MKYPFPIDEYHKYPELIEVKGKNFEKVKDGVMFFMSLRPSQEETLEVVYRQKLKDEKARYILKTTKKWNRPLQRADFYIEFPESLNFKVNYEPDSIKKSGRKRVIYIHRENFMPEEDLWMEWKY